MLSVISSGENSGFAGKQRQGYPAQAAGGVKMSVKTVRINA